MQPQQANIVIVTIIAAIIGVIGTLLGVIIAYLLSQRAAKIQCRRIAGAKLRAAFAPEIAQYDLLYGKQFDGPPIKEMLENALPKHAASIEEYRCFVPTKYQREYQNAWDDYYKEEGNIFLVRYAVRDNRRELFKQKIDAIFKFTVV